ncbi:hypothetical protein SSS_07082 [Sarcoptes scabiei]|uniref:Uncharacterized protein n=1 Tax=Sarcoptes scabiei TaxID=52283 RepID=A0A834VIL6_SARSC|nr:hypothetical protein SSS_07082 [Sarcoptes scabiei]
MDFDTNNFEQRSTNIDCVYLKSDRKELPISRSRYEKPTTARQERRILSKRSELANSTIAYDPAVQQEFIRLRDSVPSIAGHEEINEIVEMVKIRQILSPSSSLLDHLWSRYSNLNFDNVAAVDIFVVDADTADDVEDDDRFNL